MSEVGQIPWGKVISNFIWIVGAAVILTAFSYHEFLRHEEGAKLRDIVRRESFKRPFLAGMILVAAGVGASVRSPLLTAVAGCAAFLLLILFIKTYVSQK
jgi:hypothetical protein